MGEGKDEMMHHFDLHCDTLNECRKGKASLIHNDYNVSVERGMLFDRWVQTFAAFVHDDCRGVKAYRRFLAQVKVLQDAFAESDKIVPYDPKNVREGVCNAMLSVENGAALGGKLERIPEFRELGVRILSLTWNGENELAGGADSETGLTALGKKAVKELEANRIVIDVSHLNNISFWELCEIAQRPFIATHSNCFDLCPHKRNLDDLQIQEIIRRKGLIGVNFYPIFINGESDASFQELRAHIRHIVALGGEDVIAVGSDFDGAAALSRLNRIEKVSDWHENLSKHFDPEFVDKITFKNAQRFFEENL